MKKFAALMIKGKLAIYELEVEIVTPLQDPSVMWLPKDEYAVNVLAPPNLIEKDMKGRTLRTIYYSHSLFDSVEDALSWYENSVSITMKARAERHGEKFTDEDIKSKINDITIIKL